MKIRETTSTATIRFYCQALVSRNLTYRKGPIAFRRHCKRNATSKVRACFYAPAHGANRTWATFWTPTIMETSGAGTSDFRPIATQADRDGHANGRAIVNRGLFIPSRREFSYSAPQKRLLSRKRCERSTPSTAPAILLFEKCHFSIENMFTRAKLLLISRFSA
jgi:hypothetical protein